VPVDNPVIEKQLVELTEQIRSKYYGKYRGIVQDPDDPDSLGRVTARVPEVYGEEDSPWALPAVPFAGSSHGLILLPEKGDGVWFEFEAGDPSRPIWTGAWWASGELPSDGGVKKRALVTSSGHKLIFDEDGSLIQLKHSSGGEITMTDTDITIKIGSSQIVLSASGVDINNGAFTVR
jgi:uncharacterized protein involved in type VI secretion and phage assembly